MEIQVLYRDKPIPKFLTYIVHIKFADWEDRVLEYPLEGNPDQELIMHCELRLLLLHKQGGVAGQFYFNPYVEEMETWDNVPAQNKWTVYDFIREFTGHPSSAFIDEITSIEVSFWDYNGNLHECEIRDAVTFDLYRN